jgi:hypothetical protein
VKIRESEVIPGARLTFCRCRHDRETLAVARADVEQKFRSNVEARWPRQRTDDILRALWALDQADDLSSLLGGLVVQKLP